MSDTNFASKIKKAAMNRWVVFCVLTFSGGVAFKIESMKDMFYVPMQEFMGLSHTQIGAALSVYGIVQTIGLIFGIYLCDMFSKKYMVGFGLLGISCVGIYLSTFPGYYGFLIAYGVLALFAEVIYWPPLLKAIRLIGDEKTQGRMFGFLEAGRGVVDVIVASSALAVFKMAGENGGALRTAYLFLAVVIALTGILCLIMIPNDERKVDETGKEVNRFKSSMDGVMMAVKNFDIWLVAIQGFVVYTMYCGLTYFIPFLNEIYLLPATAVGVYGIINQYGLKMIGGPAGGLLADKVWKSATKHIRGAFVVSIAAMAVFLMLPHDELGQEGNWLLGAVFTLGFGTIIFSMRSVFFAPMDEIKVPVDITGAAMSLGSLVIYLPSTFAYVMYGKLLDTYPGMTGYKVVFGCMIVWAVVGVAVSTVLNRRIKKIQRNEIA
ncbi:MAG: MFS transporter [Roseburia sp.]